MKKEMKDKSKLKAIILTVASVLFVLFVLLPLVFSLFDNKRTGNVALIPIEGLITGGGTDYLGSQTVSSKIIVNFIKEADENPSVKVILLEINSPGGSAVASDEIASTVKKTKKPTVALIREVGASGGYWVASATDYVIANRMSITGSIGVISSYLEFSGLMDQYGVGYERLVAGNLKDMGTPYKKLADNEKEVLQSKLDKIHEFFIEEISKNRKLEISKVKEISTGEFFLGVEAYNLGLVDGLGDRDTTEEFIKSSYGLEKVHYAVYEQEKGLFDLFGNVLSKVSFKIGEGFASFLTKKSNSPLLM
ncbi:MAG: signal peptide peptidase SppA [Nanoarchaeota archaeon]|nr:signal peptide peptidase SppA [Nanoarchaeota archaeon]MBU1644188.1 signal peptide peptidase SppA [Nanoarchaeota archaeon]MBU1977037.1 signal peptide peptidase SppA [Nanoarchaeota archaeon]